MTDIGKTEARPGDYVIHERADGLHVIDGIDPEGKRYVVRDMGFTMRTAKEIARVGANRKGRVLFSSHSEPDALYEFEPFEPFKPY
jgi:hypothetical protein